MERDYGYQYGTAARKEPDDGIEVPYFVTPEYQRLKREKELRRQQLEREYYQRELAERERQRRERYKKPVIAFTKPHARTITRMNAPTQPKEIINCANSSLKWPLYFL